tara:strand:- start:383 stop:757 length:375 start_codon:yes stop_codon:yes gene_type:complete
MDNKKLINKITELILDKHGLEIKIINVSKLTSLTDYFIICSSDSNPKTKALLNHIVDNIKNEFDIKPLNSEGIENLDWVLLDYINIVVNIFSPEKRNYYNIEKLWGDAEITIIKESFDNEKTSN